MVVSLIKYGFASIAILLGLGILYYSYSMFKQYQLIRDLPISTVQSLSVGYVEIEGKVESVTPDATSLHPLTGDETVFYQQTLTRHYGSKFETLEQTMVGDSFLVDDGTGAVEVKVDNPRLDFDSEHVESREYHLHPDDEVPAFLEEYHQDISVSDLPDNISEVTYEFTIYSLRPGDTVFVFGEAEMRDDVTSSVNEENLRIVNPDSRNWMLASLLPHEIRGINGVLSSRGLPQIISTRTDDEFVSIAKTVVPASTAIGLLMIGTAVWFLLTV